MMALGDLRDVPVDKYPYLRFNACFVGVPAGQFVNLQVLKLFFNGERDVFPHVGGGRFIGGDSSWHTVEVNLQAHGNLRSGDPFGVVLADIAGGVARPGSTILVDNVTVFSRHDPHPGFEWSAPPDVSGIQGYSWVFDRTAVTVPPEKVCAENASVTVEASDPGTWWFHVRAVDRAGNWSTTGRCWIRID